jgi:hypothetical protein
MLGSEYKKKLYNYRILTWDTSIDGYALSNIHIIDVFELFRFIDRGRLLVMYINDDTVKLENIKHIEMCEKNIDELHQCGAYRTIVSDLHDNEESAIQQLVSICILNKIKSSDICEVTHGKLNAENYLKLSKKMIDEFPERFI